MRFEVEIQQKIANLKVESLTNSIAKESASDDVTDLDEIAISNGRLRRRTPSASDDFVVGPLRGRTPSASDDFVVGPLRGRTPSASRLRRS